MRMDPRNNTLTAAEVINHYTEADLARVLRMYGEEKFASRIAKFVVQQRAKAPIETTLELVDVVKRAIPAAARREGGHHPARRTFQALRIEVNHEMDALRQGLEVAVRWLNPGGRICVISYHSLEDRIVKDLFRELSQGCTCPPDLSDLRVWERAGPQVGRAQAACAQRGGGRAEPALAQRQDSLGPQDCVTAAALPGTLGSF